MTYPTPSILSIAPNEQETTGLLSQQEDLAPTPAFIEGVQFGTKDRKKINITPYDRYQREVPIRKSSQSRVSLPRRFPGDPLGSWIPLTGGFLCFFSPSSVQGSSSPAEPTLRLALQILVVAWWLSRRLGFFSLLMGFA